MFSTILLPIDLGHDASWAKALPLAEGLRGETGALHLLAVMPDLGQGIVSSHFPMNFKRDTLKELDAALRAFIGERKLERATAHVGYGHVAEAIIRNAEGIDADLIVMASHPPDELRSVLVGSQAARVVRHATMPVLVAR